MTVEAIMQAITALPVEERHALAAWLNELDYDAWDKQMVADFSEGGGGLALVEKAKRLLANAGKGKPPVEGDEVD